jgi:hypothetical protein
MLTDETSAKIAYGLACVQLAQRLRDLPGDHPLAIAAADAGIEPILDPGPPSISLIAKYAGVTKTTVRRLESIALARAARNARQLGLDPSILSPNSKLQTPNSKLP